ncbi:MAG: hypothetical protein II920_08035 [Clostridia bacterium]|nr:hypothetical protein [Clostridia bacterium]
MKDFADSTLFTVIHEREIETEICILKPEISIHQGLMPGADSFMSEDGRYLWFSAVFAPNGFLPGGRRAAAVWDRESDQLVLRRDIQPDSGFWVAPNGDAVWGTANQILRASPQERSGVRRVFEVPASMRTFPGKAASRISCEAGNKYCLIIDVSEADTAVVGSLETQSACFTHWARLTGGWHSPEANPLKAGQALILRGPWHSYSNGENHPLETDADGNCMSLWVIAQGGEAKCLPTGPAPVTEARWSLDGEKIYYTCDNGVFSISTKTEQRERIDAAPARHLSLSSDGAWMCVDHPRDEREGKAGAWSLINLNNGKRCVFPMPAADRESASSPYETEPAPRFCLNDKYILFNCFEGRALTLAAIKADEIKSRIV